MFLLRDADGVRASELEHAVEDMDGKGDFGVLPGIDLRSRPVADDLLEPVDRSLDSLFAIAKGWPENSHGWARSGVLMCHGGLSLRAWGGA